MMNCKFHMVGTQDNVRLDRYMRGMLGRIRQSKLERLLRNKDILVNDSKTSSNYIVQAGDIISCVHEFKFLQDSEISDTNVSDGRSDSRRFEKMVIFENENIIAINKPFGLCVQGDMKVGESISDFLPSGCRIVHRLDKHTTGVLLFAKNLETTREIGYAFSTCNVKKKYVALVVGRPKLDSGVIDLNLRGSTCKKSGREGMAVSSSLGLKAVTEYNVVANCGDFSCLELYPHTGRKHQLRVHMNALGCPILGDGKYGGSRAIVDGIGCKMHLHALSIAFDVSGESLIIRADLPKTFLKSLHKCFGKDEADSIVNKVCGPSSFMSIPVVEGGYSRDRNKLGAAEAVDGYASCMGETQESFSRQVRIS